MTRSIVRRISSLVVLIAMAMVSAVQADEVDAQKSFGDDPAHLAFRNDSL